jgi:hypothetical protein
MYILVDFVLHGDIVIRTVIAFKSYSYKVQH